MKCPVCEALLVNGECAECQALSEALGALRDEQLPSLMVKIPRRGRVVYPWVAAAAAAAILMLALPHLRRADQIPAIRQLPSLPAQMPAKAEPLKIKILTPDPNIVIYWLVTPKEGQ
jgi:hypothetical protein